MKDIDREMLIPDCACGNNDFKIMEFARWDGKWHSIEIRCPVCGRREFRDGKNRKIAVVAVLEAWNERQEA